MIKAIANYLGCPASHLLEDVRFKDWEVTRLLDEEAETLTFDFAERGLSLRCDMDERIASVFVYAEGRSGLVEGILTFGLTRQQTLDLFGTPEKSGSARRDPILGEYGPWDRFVRPGHMMHVEYRADADRIKMITLMRLDVAP